MTNQRRVTIVILSVLAGTLLSFGLFKLKRNGQELSQNDMLTLWTNFGFSIIIILCVGFFFLWKKKKDL